MVYLKTIVLTHAHSDHTGGLAELVRRSGAQVLAHDTHGMPLVLAVTTPGRRNYCFGLTSIGNSSCAAQSTMEPS